MAAFGAKTIPQLFLAQAEASAERPAFVWREAGQQGWRKATWQDARRMATSMAVALRGMGVEHGDRVAIMASNRPQHVVADLGALLAGATPVSVYPTLTVDQIAHVAGDCEAKVVVLDGPDEFARWNAARDRLPDLDHVVVIDDAASCDGALDWADVLADGLADLEAKADDVRAWADAVGAKDLATLIYTSGTTGPPKGTKLTHENVIVTLEAVTDVVSDQRNPVGVSYLPLAHIAERMVTYYRGLDTGGEVWFAASPKDVVEVVQAARPHGFLAVPRVWEKMHAGLNAKLAAEEDGRRKDLVFKAIDIGRQVLDRKQAGKSVPLKLRIEHEAVDKLVLSKLRARLGFDRVEFAISGAAPIAPEILRFFGSLGIEILEVYGMTETTGLISANRPGRTRIGSVGEPIPGVEVRIADDGEILARGKNMTSGYLNLPEATAETIDADGWLHTGDLGSLDDDGYLSVTGRKKELIITAGGKNLSPNNIEETVKSASPIIGQVLAYGDQRPYVVALVVLDGEALPAWCESNGVPFESVAAASDQPEVIAEVEAAIARANEHLHKVEQIKRHAILAQEWTAESEELTPTLKLKRSVIHDKYADTIAGIYA